MKKLKQFLPLFFVTATVAGIVLLAASQVQATISSYTASAFSQFCSQNSSICNKVNFSGSTSVRSVSCPSQNQVVQNVYVHAGDGQTVYQLPHAGFTYVINGNSVTVTKTTHPHNFSWIGVVCGDAPTPTPTVVPTATPTPTSAPTPTPTLEPTVTPSPTPEVTPTPPVDPTVTPTPEVTPTPTEEPTVTPTPGVDPTPTQGVDPTPSPVITPGPSKHSSLGYNLTCSTSGIEVTMDLIEADGKGAKDVEVTFTYLGEIKKVKTNIDGRARTDYGKNGNGKIEGKADGWSTQSVEVTMPEGCDPGVGGGQVLGTTTGQVLGASTLANTGTADETMAYVSMILGTLLLSVSGVRYANQKV